MFSSGGKHRNHLVPFLLGKTQFQSCHSLPSAGIVGTGVHTQLVGLTFESEAIADCEELHISEVPGQCVG